MALHWIILRVPRVASVTTRNHAWTTLVPRRVTHHAVSNLEEWIAVVNWSPPFVTLLRIENCSVFNDQGPMRKPRSRVQVPAGRKFGARTTHDEIARVGEELEAQLICTWCHAALVLVLTRHDVWAAKRSVSIPAMPMSPRKGETINNQHVNSC